ncbi:hypothetical protein CHS0354_034853 [Potamilus streckersoni]|uniref:EF-hand domain-containing protein n=1 Tax=Potamilus streckersoni TaxID=2493646 RepID=A0AAE0TJ88_9BIVA|nr:hypothetical protein CHS0354_034853 [Potamilus streckersoni]
MSELTDEQIEERIRDSFENFDKDGSGTLNARELADALRLTGLNPTDKEVAEILKKQDKNRDGLLSYDEYREIVGPQLLLFEEKNQALEDAFEVYDKNGDGRLTKNEFRSMLCDKGEEPLTDEDINELMTQLDKDGDGTVSLKEFKALLSSY